MSNISKLVADLALEEKSNNEFLHLTVNENQLSKTANRLLSSKLSERYYFGGGNDRVIDFGTYTFLGLPAVENIVSAAEKALKQMTGAAVVNLNCYSGLHAMMCAILAATNPGDTVMSLRFDDGGHGATRGIIESLGRKYVFAEFDQEKLDFNLEKTAEVFRTNNVKAIYIDISVHLNSIRINSLRSVLGPDAIIIYDASHSLGLILGKQFSSPLNDGADIVCSNTHKTFAGPQRGIILFKDEQFGKDADWLIKTTFTSSVHTSELMALAVSLLEYEQFGEAYASQVVENSRALAQVFIDLGWEVRRSNTGRFSDNEQVHLFIDKAGDRVELFGRLIRNYISCNFMQVLGGRSFARIGVQEITRRGMQVADMDMVASLFSRALRGDDVRSEVLEFNRKFSEIKFSFDG